MDVGLLLLLVFRSAAGSPSHGLDQFCLLQLAPPRAQVPGAERQRHPLRTAVPGGNSTGTSAAGGEPAADLVHRKAAAAAASAAGAPPPEQQRQSWSLLDVRGAASAWLEAVRSQEPSLLQLVQLALIAAFAVSMRLGRCGGEEEKEEGNPEEGRPYFQCLSKPVDRGVDELHKIDGFIEPMRW
mmetsp:Transcript_63634/g.197062  ORF Transcript_63634/g.197062 Transcript_63634/m.197062 type:complete len:184 (-) Transcript_63634:97-648(-)